MKTSNTEETETELKARFGAERWGGLILWYVILTLLLLGAMVLAGWFAWTTGIIPGSR